MHDVGHQDVEFITTQNDRIFDVKFVGENDSLLSIATNSPQVKVIERETMDCRILNGHTGKEELFIFA